MRECTKHSQKRKYCERCLLDVNAEQALLFEQYQQRFDALWEEPGFQNSMLAVEKRYPLGNTAVLSVIPFPKDLLSLTKGAKLIRELLAEYARVKTSAPDARIGANKNGFFIYRFSNTAPSKG